MIIALDVDYRLNTSMTACVGFHTWTDATAELEQVTALPVEAAAYEPGAFYRRELPCLLHALGQLTQAPTVVVVDGYVWLGPGRLGLGAHLYQALNETVAVVGVAKGPFRGAAAVEVLRGRSRRPLYVTAAGIDPQAAAMEVGSMHGPHRIPTLLKRVDRLARDA